MTTENKFLAAVDVIKSIPCEGAFEPSEEMMVKLYAFEMQSKVGPCTTAKPHVGSNSSRKKWLYWKSLGDMPKETAMEKYIEELAKVVETMAFNEKISKFMSLMGPFYESVSVEECEEMDKEKNKSLNETSVSSSILREYSSPTLLEIYHLTKNMDHDSSYHHSNPGTSQREIYKNEGPSLNKLNIHSSSSSSSELSNFDLLSDLSDVESSDSIEVIDLKESDEVKNSFTNVSSDIEKDLSLTILNLQSSLDDVVKKLDNLNGLAKTATAQEDSDLNQLHHDKWRLNLTGTAFAFLWPLAVELCFGPLE